MSARPDPSAAVSGSSRTHVQAPYGLDTYLRGPPESVTERLLANQISGQSTPSPVDIRNQTKRELKDWQDSFDRAAKPKDK
ncbi:hypothetical protein GGR53DRAFT_461405 [Hypoxylon sp. FL1150]|nr:hypothetical protein GGR53DRAFT_461405 [Hypoxylon sp. FL1150]